MYSFIFVPREGSSDLDVHPADDLDDVNAAARALAAAGLTEAHVYVGDPNGEHYRNGSVVWAARTHTPTVAPPLPFESTRAAALRAASHWLAEHLAWVPADDRVKIELPHEGQREWPAEGQPYPMRPRIVISGSEVPPEKWAAGVARYWEDAPTTWRELPLPSRGCRSR